MLLLFSISLVKVQIIWLLEKWELHSFVDGVSRSQDVMQGGRNTHACMIALFFQSGRNERTHKQNERRSKAKAGKASTGRVTISSKTSSPCGRVAPSLRLGRRQVETRRKTRPFPRLRLRVGVHARPYVRRCAWPPYPAGGPFRRRRPLRPTRSHARTGRGVSAAEWSRPTGDAAAGVRSRARHVPCPPRARRPAMVWAAAVSSCPPARPWFWRGFYYSEVSFFGRKSLVPVHDRTRRASQI
jgi:hypothetical protein